MLLWLLLVLLILLLLLLQLVLVVVPTIATLVATFEEDAESHDPLLPADEAVVVRVEPLEHPVQQDVVRHLKRVVQELTEAGAVQAVGVVDALSQFPKFKNEMLKIRTLPFLFGKPDDVLGDFKILACRVRGDPPSR